MKRILILVTILFVALASCKKEHEYHEIAQTPELAKPAPADNNVVAHRGGASEKGCPDNSLEALNYAISLGLYASECDIYMTKDQKVIVAHADGSDRVNGFHPWEATYQQIISAGKLANGETIPTLEQYLDRALEAGSTMLWLDVKSISAVPAAEANDYSAQAAELACDIIREKEANHFVQFIVGREAVLKRCVAAVKGDWDCAYMNTAVSPESFKSKGYNWANFSIDAVFYNNGSVSGEYSIEDYNAQGVKVSVYNVDTDLNRTWYGAKAKTLYAICTNYPKAMLDALQ